MGFFISVFAFVVALGLLVTFHEFGHFSVARLLGVKVLRFSVGFGKPLWSRTAKDGVEYVVAMIPLGGYVRMLDEQEAPVAEADQKYAFNRKPLWVRSLIVLAGPVFNFIFAIVVFTWMYLIGVIGVAPILGAVTPDSVAERAGLQTGMEILTVENQVTQTWQQAYMKLLGEVGSPTINMTVLDSGRAHEKSITLVIPQWNVNTKDGDPLFELGLEPFRPKVPAVIGKVLEGERGALAGLLPNDQIIQVDGEPISFWHEVVQKVQNKPEQRMTLTVLREGREQVLVATPGARLVNGKELGHLGLILVPHQMPPHLIRHEKYSFFDSFSRAIEKTWDDSLLTLRMLGKMLSGLIGLQNLSGPISIAEGAGATMQMGFAYYLGFLGMISISLGVINLLPVPMLDGGHLMYYLIELVFRKPLSEAWMLRAHKLGLLFIALLMSVAFYNDLMRLF